MMATLYTDRMKSVSRLAGMFLQFLVVFLAFPALADAVVEADDDSSANRVEARNRVVSIKIILPHTRFATRCYTIESGVGGPTVLITGGVHGDESAGVFAAEAIRRWPLKAGRMIVIPAATAFGGRQMYGRNARAGRPGCSPSGPLRQGTGSRPAETAEEETVPRVEFPVSFARPLCAWQIARTGQPGSQTMGCFRRSIAGHHARPGTGQAA